MSPLKLNISMHTALSPVNASSGIFIDPGFLNEEVHVDVPLAPLQTFFFFFTFYMGIAKMFFFFYFI